MFLIYRADLSAGSFALTRDEIQHARARRLQSGDLIHVGDGVSQRMAAVFDAAKSEVRVTQTAAAFVEPCRILCVAIPGGGRWDWLLQKAVECGVTHVVPVNFAHSERKDVGRRSSRIVEAAAAQSQRYFLPQVMPVVSLLDLPDHLAGLEKSAADPEGGAGILLEPGLSPELAPSDLGLCTQNVLVVGPEAGLQTEEQSFLIESGFLPRRLGYTVLRIETAAVVALGRWLIA